LTLSNLTTVSKAYLKDSSNFIGSLNLGQLSSKIVASFSTAAICRHSYF